MAALDRDMLELAATVEECVATGRYGALAVVLVGRDGTAETRFLILDGPHTRLPLLAGVTLLQHRLAQFLNAEAPRGEGR